MKSLIVTTLIAALLGFYYVEHPGYFRFFGPTVPPDTSRQNTFLIHLDPSDCQVNIEKSLSTNSRYEERIDEAAGLRYIRINSIPNHPIGDFPNNGNPHMVEVHEMKRTVPLKGKIASRITWARGYDTGILFSGVCIDPFTGEFFIGSTGKFNRAWNITTLTSSVNLGLDCNNAHVQPSGKYHYHGAPTAFLESLGVDGKSMIKIGYAADGFPIYYKYGYDENGQIVSFQSGYQLKKGKRPGDGIAAPDGYHNGRYFNDYEYINESSLLDECNGRWGKTADSDWEYYYVVTDNFPSVPICFTGTPNEDFAKMGGRHRGPRRNRPRH